MDTTRATWLIYNGSSGSFEPELLHDLIAALDAVGHRPTRVLDCCEDDIPDADTANAAGVGMIAILGGDGTLSRTIAGLEGFGGSILPLPGGTFNLLCRTLHGERDPLEIVADLGAERLVSQRRPCIRGGGGLLALSEVLAGPGANWAEVREELRDGNIAEVFAKGFEAATESTAGPMVAVVNPPRGRSDGYSGVRLVPGAQGIGIAGYGVEGFLALLQQGAAILACDFREGPHDDLGSAQAVTCRSQDKAPIALMVDGELGEGAAEAVFSLDMLGVDLLGPANGR